MKFTKRPVTIEAVLWNGSNTSEIEAFTGEHHFWFNGADENPPKLGIRTLEGKLLAAVGDWIIKGVKGEFYPCKPDIFAATYVEAVATVEGPVTKATAVATAKSFRKEADELLQKMKTQKAALIQRSHEGRGVVELRPHGETFEDINECIAQHILSIRDLEGCIMRQGMALKYIGNPDPYPQSRNPDSPVVEPTADGLKL